MIIDVVKFNETDHRPTSDQFFTVTRYYFVEYILGEI